MHFLSPPSLQALTLTPHPWSAPYPLYYIITSMKNDDGHGGYTRLNQFDEEGIPYKPTAKGRKYHPLVVAGYASKMLAIAAVTGNAEAAARARRMISPLVASSRRTGAWGVGPSPNTMISQTAHSNIQGAAISALIRLTAGRPAGDVSAAIQRGAERLLRPVENGGTMGFLDEGPFLQEAPGTPVRDILNGCVAGLFGLYDLADALDHDEARNAATGIDRTIVRAIGRFHAPGGWSFYALDAYGTPYFASAYYHWLAIAQIRLIAMRTHSQPLLDALEIWEGALKSVRKRCLAAVAKTAQVCWLRDIRRLRLDIWA